MDASLVEEVFPPQVRARMEQTAEVWPAGVLEDFDSPDAVDALRTAEVLVTGWGCPPLDAAVLGRAPRLRAVLHAAGTVKTFLSPGVFERGIAVSSAAEANAVPVAEFTLAAIVLGAKRALPLARLYGRRRTQRTAADLARPAWMGAHGLTVGLVGASRTGRRVAELLRTLDVEVLFYDPYTAEADIQALGARQVDLDTLVATSDVVSVHAPATAETRHLIDAHRLELMRPGTLVVNTARGSLVDTEALTAHLVSGRLDAVLDVTDPEPLPPDHPLWDLPNVWLTPHLAGALGNESARLGALVVDELERFAAGEPLRHPVLWPDWDRTA
ncbi:hydroxyacid dehydrogenase [Actinacidiphila yeochonensis]|uniref:hydroxyacid dehydrogenase n=1 Tax=Actinacidiphila yeochonensis TaxID=89050 RepID=UPI00068E576D|nr:hydroxyacid dehydrogenase [Actinacidiphila yeochonensis]